MKSLYSKHQRVGDLELIRFYKKLIKASGLKGYAVYRLKQLQDRYRGGNGNLG